MFHRIGGGASALAVALVLAGCATSPAKSVFAAKTGLTVAEAGVVAYGQLPRCEAAAPVPLCNNPAVFQRLAAGKDIARASINQAEAAVRSPTASKSEALQWAATALSAVQALQKSLAAATAAPPTATPAKVPSQ